MVFQPSWVFLINARLRKDTPPELYDERFSDDKFGILVSCSADQLEEVENILRDMDLKRFKLMELKMKNKIILFLLLSLSLNAHALPWSTDMWEHPSIKPYEEARDYPENNVRKGRKSRVNQGRI